MRNFNLQKISNILTEKKTNSQQVYNVYLLLIPLTFGVFGYSFIHNAGFGLQIDTP